VGVAFYIIKSIATQTLSDLRNSFNPSTHLELGLIRSELFIAVFSIILLEVVHILQKKNNPNTLLKAQPAYVRWALYYAFLFVLLLFHTSGSKQFIYFQF